MEPVTWSKENWMVEQHRQRHDPWRGKGYKKGGKETCHPRERKGNTSGGHRRPIKGGGSKCLLV